jgi:hypothetical protein
MMPKTTSNRRTFDSYYRRSQFQDYGGREWCHILLATGDVDDLIVRLMGELVEERRTLASTQGQRPVPSARSQRPGPALGVQHTESDPKKARNHAKSLDKRLLEQQAWWDAGLRDRCLAWPQWHELQMARDRAWDWAERLSIESGFPYFDRNGVRQQDEPRDLVGLALRRWCAQRGIAYLDA